MNELQAHENEPEIKEAMSLMEIANILGYEKDYLRKLVKKLFPESVINGIETKLNEDQISELKKNLAPRTLDLKVQGQNATTSIERKETVMRAIQYLTEDLEVEIKKRKELEELRKQDQPKLEFYENISSTDKTISFREFGRITGLGEKKVFKLARLLKLIDDKNQAYQKYIDEGYFKLKEGVWGKENENPYFQTRITGKGQTWLFEKLKK